MLSASLFPSHASPTHFSLCASIILWLTSWLTSHAWRPQDCMLCMRCSMCPVSFNRFAAECNCQNGLCVDCRCTKLSWMAQTRLQSSECRMSPHMPEIVLWASASASRWGPAVSCTAPSCIAEAVHLLQVPQPS